MARSRRTASRVKKRVRVEFGEKELEHRGFTEDISVGGLFLRANKLLPIGTRVHMQVNWETDFFYVEGVVVRHKQVTPGLRVLEKQGMGIRFLTPAEVVDLVVPSGLQTDKSLTLDCASPEAARKMVAEQLSRGVLFVPVSDPPPVPAQVVDFAIRLPFRTGVPPIRGRGRVVQLLPRGYGEQGARAGAVVEVESAAVLCDALTKAAAG